LLAGCTGEKPMKIVIEIKCDNAAFEDDRYEEIVSNLNAASAWAARVGEQTNNPGTVKTSNITDADGNACGTVTVTWES
jgi:hypothetical protein